MDPYLLVGMLDSPFVRRVAIALELYGFPYENLPLGTVSEAERFKAYSPLMRAPTLVIPGGQVLFDSHLILAYLDEQDGQRVALLPRTPSDRLLCRQIMGVACGLADKAVSALYEKVFHPKEVRSERVLSRNEQQLNEALRWLDERAFGSEFFLGSSISHADIACAAALTFALESHPDLLSLKETPRVAALHQRLEERPEFRKTYLKLDPPK